MGKGNQVLLLLDRGTVKTVTNKGNINGSFCIAQCLFFLEGV